MRKELKFYMPRPGSVPVMQILEKNVRCDKVEMGGEQGTYIFCRKRKWSFFIVLQLKWLSDYRDPEHSTWVQRLIH